MAVIEQFENLVANLSEFMQTLPQGQQQELDVHITTLKSLIEVLNEDGIINGSVLTKVGRSKIERLQIGGELLKRRSQYTVAELASMYSLAPETIRRFFRQYENARPKEKVQMERTSIMDSAAQMEQLAIVIQRNMARLEGANDDVNVKFVGEMSKLIALSIQYAEKMAQFERMRRLEELIAEVLMDELPHKRTEILRRIGAAGNNVTTRSILKQATVDAELST